jgi:hypothetical protein
MKKRCCAAVVSKVEHCTRQPSNRSYQGKKRGSALQKQTIQHYNCIIIHKRWGHQDKQHVRQMLKSELGIDVKLGRDICEPCVLGKAHKLPLCATVREMSTSRA